MDKLQEAKDYFERGQEAFNKRNYDYAIELFQAALSLAPDLAPAHHLLWLSFKKKAEEYPPSAFKKAFIRVKTSPLFLKAGYLLRKGRALEAISQYRRILEACPSDVSALINMAGAFLREKMDDCAIKTLEDVIQLKPDQIAALKHLGKLYLKRGDLAKARSSFETILKISPGEPEAQRELKNLDALGTIQKSFTQET